MNNSNKYATKQKKKNLENSPKIILFYSNKIKLEVNKIFKKE